MAALPVKSYNITSNSTLNNHRLIIQQAGIPFLWVNSNNKYGPWKAPFVTLHSDAHNGPVVAAAMMGYPGCARDFRIRLGNPDCTDPKTWPVVKCRGKWAHEYQFCVDVDGGLPLRFAWRRTRDKGLGAKGNGNRDFKLVAIDTPPIFEEIGSQRTSTKAKYLLDSSNEEDEYKDADPYSKESAPSPDTTEYPDKSERVVAAYIHDTEWRSSARRAHIDFFERVPPDVELSCLTVVTGLQEKIGRNREVFAWSSLGYGGLLTPLGSYV